MPRDCGFIKVVVPQQPDSDVAATDWFKNLVHHHMNFGVDDD